MMEMPPGFGEKMEVDLAASERDSSSLSPPMSPHGLTDTIRVARPPFSNPQISGEGVANATSVSSAHAAIAANSAAHAQNSSTSTPTATNGDGTAVEKPKRIRRKREYDAEGNPLPLPKKPRKPRAPNKDKPPGSTTTTAAPRRKPKTENESATHDAPTGSRQPTLAETIMAKSNPSLPQTSMTMQPRPQHSNSLSLPASNPATPRPVSSGQNYDPVRGYDPVRAATLETSQSRPANASTSGPSAQASPHMNRASASPSIASLIDPPMLAKTMTSSSNPAISSNGTTQHTFSVPSQQPSPTPQKPTPSFFPHPPPPHSRAQSISMPNSTSLSHLDGAMDIDLACEAPKAPAEVKPSIKSSSSSAPTPKAARPTPPPPKGTGSGLLSTSALFGGPSSNEGAERKGVNIDIHIPLNPRGGNTINMAHEIHKKYGRDAINPRAAAHREQLLKIQAAASKMDGGSADDMSVDLMSDNDESNVEMGGMDDEKSATGADGEPKPKRQRRKKVEEYDKEDDFIDDTELAWQEQAAVAKDGFFVYSGPLVPAGQTPQLESAASTRGGRGRGRGGRSRGGATTTGTTHVSLPEKTLETTAPARARGRARATGAPRKPRITKADRERMESEKADRERSGAGGNSLLAPTPPQPAYAAKTAA